jgi:FtsP/CotA-like multicopper oxidase with cupredoxin domain
MDRRQRMTLLGVAAAVAVVAIVIALVAGGGGDSKDNSKTGTTAAQTASGSGDTSATTGTTPPKPAGTEATVNVKGGQPDGGVQKIKVGKNEPLQITVTSDQNVPIHFHGYDIEKPAAPGKPAVFKLKKANIDGVFEMEVESTKTKIASITVSP